MIVELQQIQSSSAFAEMSVAKQFINSGRVTSAAFQDYPVSTFNSEQDNKSSSVAESAIMPWIALQRCCPLQPSIQVS